LVFEPNKKVESLWYVYHTLTQRDLNQLRNKNTQPLITGTIVKNESIPYPPLSEQEQIVSYLDEKTSQIDKTIDIEKKKIELLKEYRQSLISNVVTGKIKVIE
jgi:type I restriction enzyme S subunit